MQDLLNLIPVSDLQYVAYAVVVAALAMKLLPVPTATSSKVYALVYRGLNAVAINPALVAIEKEILHG